MVCPCSSAFSARASFFLGVSGRMVERYISKFPVTGDVKSEIIGSSYEETRKGFQLKKHEFLLSLELRILKQTFTVGVFISTQGGRN